MLYYIRNIVLLLLLPLLSFGFTIGDRVWNDSNEDWEQNSNELGYANVTVELYDGNGKRLKSTKTNASGKYQFKNLSEGEYTVSVVKPADGTIVTTQSIGLWLETNRDDIDFGIVKDGGTPKLYSIGDRVWNDLNEDWEENNHEPGLANVTVELYDGKGKKIKTTKSNSEGYYKFSNLKEGEYTVKVVTPPNGTQVTTPSIGLWLEKDRDDIDFGIRKDSPALKDKVYAFFADEHNSGPGKGNRILQIDLDEMAIVDSIEVPGDLGHHADNGFNSKIYGVPKGSNFVNVIKLTKDANGKTKMKLAKKIDLIHKPRSGDAYNDKYHVILMAAANRPMASFIDVRTDKVVGTIGSEIDCTLTDGTKLLSHADANTHAGALKYQCANDDHGGNQISGHPYWLTEDVAAIVDRTNRQISVYKVSKVGNQLKGRLLNRVKTRTSIHQIVPRDRSSLPASQQMDFYAVEEGKHANPTDYSGGIAHALIHLKLTDKGLKLVRRMDLQRTKVLPKAKADRILNSCINIYRSTFSQALNGPSQSRENQYNDLFAREGITRSPDQDPYNDFPVDCFYPGIPGGHNADFAPNNKHLYVGMAGGAMSVIDVNRWKIANNIDIGIRTGPGHTCFSKKHNVALTSNHGFSNIFGNVAMTRTIRYINSERPIGYYWIRLPFDRENITSTAVSHTCYVDANEDYYYNFFTDGGDFYRIDLSRVFNNPRNGSSALVDADLYTGGIPIQGSYINLRNIKSDAPIAALRSSSASSQNESSIKGGVINNQRTESTPQTKK